MGPTSRFSCLLHSRPLVSSTSAFLFIFYFFFIFVLSSKAPRIKYVSVVWQSARPAPPFRPTENCFHLVIFCFVKNTFGALWWKALRKNAIPCNSCFNSERRSNNDTTKKNIINISMVENRILTSLEKRNFSSGYLFCYLLV